MKRDDIFSFCDYNRHTVGSVPAERSEIMKRIRMDENGDEFRTGEYQRKSDGMYSRMKSDTLDKLGRLMDFRINNKKKK